MSNMESSEREYQETIKKLTAEQKLEGTDINSEGDLTIRLYTVEGVGDRTFKAASSGNPIKGKILATIKVTRQVLNDNFDYFRAMFTRERWLEYDQSVIDIECDHPLAARIWFHAYHEGGIPASFSEMPVEEVWQVIEFGTFIQAKRPNEADFSKLETWFGEVVKHHDVTNVKNTKDNELNIRMLLYPAYIFDDAKVFASLTQLLAYSFAGHITESNPTDNRRLHLDGNMVGRMVAYCYMPVSGSLNGARGSLKNQLVGGFFQPQEEFPKLSCKCKGDSVIEYLKAVQKTEIWPVQRLQQKSIFDIIDCPGTINFACKIPENACMHCRRLLSRTVISELRMKVATSFQGICLDCVKMTKTEDVDSDYWTHDEDRAWDEDCRISHKQPTWYWSFMGRKDIMEKYQLRKKEAWERRRH
ncbi:hypothetical protein HYALB_00002379 [Hymenoscyphus albidus]|uniref:Uncharacterized protein n=1 Tax=Hymenoscyphus albidus TaxID=595503 RepID=A0A9N9LIH8_9HELO|nr:hypothetical protein HYALB_00002379 [Hymenoscyphus albidus]